MDVLLNNDVETVDFGETAMRVKLTREVIEVKEINDIGSVRILMLKGEKGDVGYPTDEQVYEAVDTWLTAHPEATTTVQDNSLTWVKFNDVLKDMMFKLGITDSKSGEMVSTSDAAEFPLKDLQSEITATQNLNGYEYPWVGGAGKNKLNVTATTVTINDVTFTVNSDGTITTSGTATATTILFVDSGKVYPSGSYILNGCPSGGGNSTYKLDVPNASYATDSGNGVTFNSDGTTGLAVRMVIYSGYGNNLTFKPMIRLASVTDADFAPYENICPISGRTEVNVTRTGVNVWDEEWEVGDINRTTGENAYASTQIRSKNYIPVFPNTGYYIHVTKSGGSDVAILYYDRNKGYLSAQWGSNRVRTTPNNCYYIRFTSNSTYGGTYEGDISINNPSTDTDYHSYNGNTYSVDWTTEAGTVYGGTLDLTTGVLTVNTGIIASYNGETIGEPWISDRDRYVAGTSPTTGAQVVYTKASETYQLDRTEVDAYFKNNTIWSDSGDVTITYLVDAKTYIDNH